MARKTLLLDTNVLVDYCSPQRAGHEACFQLVHAAVAGGHKILVTSGSLQDCYYLLKAGEKAAMRAQGLTVSEADGAAIEELAAAYIEQLTECMNVVPTDHNASRVALKLRSAHRDFEDNLVVAAAQRAGECVLVTSDRDLIVHAPVLAMTPVDALALL